MNRHLFNKPLEQQASIRQQGIGAGTLCEVNFSDLVQLFLFATACVVTSAVTTATAPILLAQC